MNQSTYANMMAQQRELLAPMTYLAEWWDPSLESAAPLEGPTPEDRMVAAGEHLRAWGLASMLAFSAGCAGTSVTRPDTRTPWTVSEEALVLQWPVEEDGGDESLALEEQEEPLPVVEYNASRLSEEVDNQRNSAALRHTNNSAAPHVGGASNEGGAGGEALSVHSVTPPGPGSPRALTEEQKDALYRHDIYGGTRCAEGLSMGFSAPVCF